jgi:carbonic anhydrase
MSLEKRYCTAVTCMDGITVLPVVEFVQQQFNSEYVDMITEPGPAGILSDHPDSVTAEQIYARIDLSVELHKTNGIAVVAHSNCLGNPKKDTEQLEDLRTSRDELVQRYPNVVIVCVWVPVGETPILVD